MRKFVFGLMAVIAVLWSLGTIIREVNTKPPREQASQNRENARVAMAARIARTLKRSMRDPDSFKLSSVRLIEKSDAICYEYRARNGFGGVNVGHAVLSDAGKFATDETDGFVPLWNKECARKSGVEETDAVTFLLDHPTS